MQTEPENRVDDAEEAAADAAGEEPENAVETVDSAETGDPGEAQDSGDTPEEDESLGTEAEIEVVEGCRRRLKASVPGEKVREELDRNYRDLAQTVQIRGFRRGRVPRQLLEARYGEDVEKEVQQSIVDTSFGEVVEERDLRVFSQPEFDKIEFDSEVEDAPLTYEAEFDVRPEFDLPEYKGVEVEGATPDVDPGEVDRELQSIRERLGEPETRDLEGAGPDDYIEGSYRLLAAADEAGEGEDEAGEGEDGGDDEGETVLREGQTQIFQPSSKVIGPFFVEDLADRVKTWLESFDPDAEEQVPLRVAATVPASFEDELLRGRPVTIEYTATGAFTRILPEADDELAIGVGAESLEDLRKTIGERIEEREKRRAERETEDQILQQLAERTEMDVPRGLVEEQVRRWRVEREQELVQEGKTREEIDRILASEEAAGGASGESGGEASGPTSPAEIRANVKKFFILEGIAEAEKIFATEKDVADRVAGMAEVYGVPHRRLQEQLEESGRLEELRQAIRHERIREFLRKKANLRSEAGGEGVSTGDSDAEGDSDAKGQCDAKGAEAAPESAEHEGA